MALFNKFFTSRKGTQNKHPDNVSEKLFAFSKDQVRVVLFRECDFRGRKLLFDSCSIKKVPVPQDRAGAAKNETEDGEKFSEISDGFGYVYTKPQTDVGQLAEMVFGSVAMSFRGTYFKMHNLESPNRLMFTQVFPSPRYSNHNRTSNSSRRTSNQSLEHSVSNKLDDSGASSINSINEQLSVHSTTSDTILVCRGPYSTPLNVPNRSNFMTSHSSMVGDSGYSADHSCVSSEPSSRWNSIFDDHRSVSVSSSSLYKRWLRSTNTSLNNSGQSLCSSVSASEFSGKHHRSSKLGLAFLIQLTCGQEEALVQFFMEHVALVESILWRARKVVELAFSKSHNFASLMVGMAHSSTQYLVSLLSGSYLSMNLWLSLMNGCDNSNSISAFSAAVSDNSAKIFRSASTNVLDVENKKQFSCSHSKGLTNSFNGLTIKPADSALDFTTLFKFLKSGEVDKKSELSNEQRAIAAEKFVREFCELLEIIDVKDTNFFMSTLVTAVLTNHLGWVNTCLPSPTPDEHNKEPFNPLWGELSDLYGALGHPTKMAQTIITGTSRKDVISKILISLTYFIRCCDIDRRIPIRADIQTENKDIETICRNCSCIPKENFKKYEDHLREIMNPEFVRQEEQEVTNVIAQENGVVALGNGMVKTKTCLRSLTDFNENVSYPDLNTSEKHLYPSFSRGMNSEKKLSRVPSSSMLCRLNGSEETFPMQGNKTQEKVVFVLGDNEKLVGLRKEMTTEKRNDNEVPQRPTFLDLSQKDKFNDGDIQKNDAKLIKPSTSWSLLNRQEGTNSQKVEPECSHSNKYTRSQSMPPEDRKLENQDTKTSKYRYSGVKFNLQQYPQILSNYMKSKNLEMTNLEFGDKGLKFDELSSINISTQYTESEGQYEETEALQTPSNASELEFTSDLFIAPPTPQHAKESKESQLNSTFVKKQVPNTIVKEAEKSKKSERKLSGQHKMKVVNFPMPKSAYNKPSLEHVKYTSSLMRAASDIYMPDMVLQGSTLPPQEWESKLKRDLILASQHSLIDQPLEEAVAVIANTDTWEVQLMSSHTFMIDKDSSGIRVGMSQLVANMLESLLQMWKLNVPPLHCLMHIEHTLQELFMQSKTLAELLLATEFCSMEQLTSALQLEVNDVPLLLAVASTHSPQVTHKYGLSFQ